MIALAGLTHIPALSAGLTAAGLDTFASIPFFTGYTLANLPIVLFIYVGVTGIGFTCYFLSMEVTSAQTTSLVFFFKPALAPLLAFLVLHEAIPAICSAGSRASSAVVWCPSSPACSRSEGPLHCWSRKARSKKKSKSESAIFTPQRTLRAFLHLLHKIRLDISCALRYCLNHLIQRHTQF